MDPLRFAQEFVALYSRRVNEAIKDLLEHKHLYQTLRVADPLAVWEEYKASNSFGGIVAGRYRPLDIARKEWLPRLSMGIEIGTPSADGLRVVIDPSLIKTYCQYCERLEPYYLSSANFHTCAELKEETSQAFTFHYYCQSCRKQYATFLINRLGIKLLLCGRAPMERLPVPDPVPKQARKHYAAAVIASHCGQTLAATALLRVCIEQFIRAETSLPTERDLDAVFETYMSKLDTFVRSRCPSLRAIYAELSSTLHAACEDAEKLKALLNDVDLHFLGRDTAARIARPSA